VDRWPETVERVAAVLRDAGIEARVEQFEEPTPTAADAARAVGCELGQVVKSLVVLCDLTPVLALIPGDRRADLGKVARAAGAVEARVAGAVEVERLTGFVPGAVAPFPLPGIAVVLMERMLLAHDDLWIGAGSVRHLASLVPTDLVGLTRAKTADLVEADT
jgi:prolyl-tRNA editing enzyme YbaK/EbsC (Cys-tRNA(Pro) deacylase)